MLVSFAQLSRGYNFKRVTSGCDRRLVAVPSVRSVRFVFLMGRGCGKFTKDGISCMSIRRLTRSLEGLGGGVSL